MDYPALHAALARLYPPDRLLTRPAQLVPYESDALTTQRARPRAVLIPETQDEVIETVRLCHRYQVPFVARGSGTSLSGASVPVPEGIVIAMNRLNRILRLDVEQRLAVVEAGVINLEVSRAAAPHGLYYAPDPSSQPICTIGGNLAFNAGGAHCLKYGVTSNHVLGMKVVLPDGEVAQLGGESLEDSGLNMVGLFVGSEGLFGIALEVTLRLLPKAEAYKTVLAAYHSLEAAGEVVAQVVASGLLPGAIEIMDNLAIQAAEAAVNAGYPLDAQALLIVELDGEAASVEADFVFLREIIHASPAYEVRIAKDESDRLRSERAQSAFSAVVAGARIISSRWGGAAQSPRRRWVASKASVRRRDPHTVFHAGDGNLHPLIPFDGREGA
jgi:glycolate oxidase